ncbi:hypothetical protein [Bacillus sp. FSL K6-0067]|uniref:hypothetical protein n=1 Tax=Bacillus sp. FSL K6-0067 TaxID=2921412 RepID=UPI00077A1062|nr:hypothetical protein [Bacillus cereus]KXY11478.1 hypothetical protein AT267_17775 [Bacillus cereus]
MQYSKEVLDKVRSGDTFLLQNLSPIATVALGLQLQQEAIEKAEASTVDFNKIGDTIHGLNNDSNSVKPAGVTFFKTREVTPQ